MSYVVIALLSLVAFSIYNVLQKVAIKYLVSDNFIFSFYYYLFVILLLVPMIFLGKIVWPTPAQIPMIAAAGLIRTVMFVTYLWTLKKLDVTVITSMFNLRVILVGLAEMLVLGTVFSWGKYAWMLVLFVGGIFLSMDEKFNWRSFFSPVMAVFGLVLVMSTSQYMAISKGLAITDLWTFTFWNFVFSLVGLIPILIYQRKNIKLPLKTTGILAVITTTFLTGVILESQAVSMNPTGTTAVLSLPGSMLLAMVVAKIKPDLIENHTWKVYAVRLASVAVMTLAVWQIVR